ncbi:MAG: substrate-binding domain-containing protein [Lutibacter sp.]|nr:substrate-binding domain-containing protein [Lutibacter sp.]MDT8416219.1 substrate-binding domain-containing protein [Lutibacter sp.]
MKKLNYIILAIAITSVFVSCDTKKKEAVEPARVSLSGAFALYPLANQWADEYNKANPDKQIRFDIQAGGAGKGMADALGGIVDLGMFSREITQAEKDKGVWWVAVTKDAVIPTISAENPALETLKKKGLTQAEFKAIFVDRTITNWKQLSGIEIDAPIKIFTRSDACGAAATWAAFIDAKQEDLKGVGVFGDPGLAEAVSKEPAGIAYNNIVYAYDINTEKKRPGIEVIPIDINGNGTIDEDENFYENVRNLLDAVAKGKFPSPPARELYFVANGKPQNQATIDFLKWVLTDGQQYVVPAGYVTLEGKYLKEQENKLN